MRTFLVTAILLLAAVKSYSQVEEAGPAIDPPVDDRIEEASRAALRMKYIGPRLPSESEDPDATPPSELPMTSTFYGPANRVSLSVNSKVIMRLPDMSGDECPPIAGDLVSVMYANDDPMRPSIGERLSGGDWCKVSHPPGLYTGPCSVTVPRPPPSGFTPTLTVDRRSLTTWFRDESDNRRSISTGGCKPVRLESGRHRIYIEVDTKLTKRFPCPADETQECSTATYVETIYEGGIKIDPQLPETDQVTDVSSLVPTFSGTDPVQSDAGRADPAPRIPGGDPLISEDVLELDRDPNDYTFVDMLGPVFTHERCTNCHSFEAPGGKIGDHIRETRFENAFDGLYWPGVDMTDHFREWVESWRPSDGIYCHRCHEPDKTQTRGFLWLPAALVLGPEARPWNTMTALEICKSIPMQYFFADGPDSFRRHVLDDGRVQWAIRNRWTPDGEIKPAPPVTWDEFVTKVNLWLDWGEMRCQPE